MTRDRESRPGVTTPEVHKALQQEAVAVFWFVQRAYAANMSVYARMPEPAAESSLIDDWLLYLAQRLLPAPEDCAHSWYNNVFRQAAQGEMIPAESALNSLRYFNTSLRCRFFDLLRRARSDYSPTPFSDTLTFLQRVQRRPWPREDPLYLFLKPFPDPVYARFTVSTFLALVRRRGEELPRFRAEISVLREHSRGMLYRALAVFHGVFSGHPEYLSMFDVALDAMLPAALSVEKSAVASALLRQESDFRMEAALNCL